MRWRRMNTQPGLNSLRTGLQVFGLLLIVVSLGRLAVVVPSWVGGAAPAYPGQYEHRLLGVLTSVPLLSVVLLMQRGAHGAPARRRPVLAWALLAISVIAMLVDASRG